MRLVNILEKIKRRVRTNILLNGTVLTNCHFQPMNTVPTGSGLTMNSVKKFKNYKDAKDYWKQYSIRPEFKTKRALQLRARRVEHGAVLARIKDVPCMDCGGRFHHCQMEFDHRPGEVKELKIGREKGAKLSRLLAEVEKCDIVCANCHAYRTWQRVQKNEEK